MKSTIVATLCVLLLLCFTISNVSATTDSVKSHLDDIIKHAQTAFDAHPLHADLTKCNADAQALRQSLVAKQNECAALAQQLKDAKDRLAALQAELAALQAQLAELENTHSAEVAAQIAELDGYIADIKLTIQSTEEYAAANPNDPGTQQLLEALRNLLAQYEAERAALLAENPAADEVKRLIGLKETEIANQQALIASLEAQVAACQAALGPLQAEIDAQDARCADIQKAIDELNAKLQKQKQLVEQIRALVAKVQTTHGGGEDASKDTWPQVKLEVEHILAGVLKEKEASDAAHAAKRAEIETKCKADENALRSKISQAEKDLAALKAQLYKLDLMIPKLEAAIVQLKELIARLEAEFSIIDKRCDKLEEDTVQDPADLKELQAIQQVIDFTNLIHSKKRITDASHNNLITKFNALKAALEKHMKEKHDKAVAAYKECLAEKSKKGDEILDAKKQLSAKEAELASVKAQIENLKKQIADLEGKIKMYNDQLRHLLDQCEKLLAAHDASKKSFAQLIADIRAILTAVQAIIDAEQK
mmetsp:Transcript_11704/g.17375  ORF Transcript_11704/g.17375 Transcript_11704/m.17375 type:complete len:537 (-) Transcript_11704:28-1638(-)